MAEVPVTVDELLPTDSGTPPAGDAKANLAGPASKGQARADETLIGTGWFGTSMSEQTFELPLQLLLKNTVGLDASAVSAFNFWAKFPIYIKPFAGILSDAVPLCGTRRRHYLIYGLLCAGACYLLLGAMPNSQTPLLAAAFLLYIFLTLNSTVLGGLMVEVGKRDHTTGRLSAQRIGINKIAGVLGGFLGGVLAQLRLFPLTMALCAAFNLLLIPLFHKRLKEPPIATRNDEVFAEAVRHLKIIFTCKTLWSAAGLVILVIISPGFNTPLLYHQQNVLKFDPSFIGTLKVVMSLGGIAGAVIYERYCRQMSLRSLLGWSIVVHTLAVPFYLFYRDAQSALFITAFEGMTQVLAILPLYDLAARATPRGSEAMGYCVMMSVWNFTHSISDLIGSALYSKLGFTFANLIWVNTGTTALVLIAVPFLPAVLMNRKDGDAEALEIAH